MRYILSSAVIVRPGHYEYKLLTELEAELWLKHGRFETRVGFRHTAKFIEERFGVRCPLSRESVVMQPGDEGLVVRLTIRPPNPAVEVDPRAEDWEIGLLKRIA